MMSAINQIPRAFKLIGTGSFLLALSLYFDWIPFLRGGEIFQWIWSHQAPPITRIIPLFIVVIIYLLGVRWLLRLNKRILLWWCMLATVAISLAVVYVRFDDVVYQLWLRSVSGITTGPHLAGAVIDWQAERTLTNWQAVMLDFDTLSGHIALSPPGLPMFNGLLNALLEPFPAITQPAYAHLLPRQCHNFIMLDYTPAEWTSSWFGVLMPRMGGSDSFSAGSMCAPLGRG